MAKIDNMMGPGVRLSTNVTTARQTPNTGFGARLQNGLNSAAGAVGTGVGAVAGMIPGGQIVSAAVSSVHTLSNNAGSGSAPYAGVMSTAVGMGGGTVAPSMGGGVAAGISGVAGGVGGGVAGPGTGALGTSTSDTVGGNFSLNQMAAENSKLLNLQAAIQQESQTFTAISNVMKSRHDCIKNSISNVR
ncbi:hypothetical protein HUA74_29400 [Myxococcus sp. CA051A]|uniref:Uncharacterized protein n=1 Tax=Myxococcus llanfairpwllgwyngyllgogerychwyrndrobwllllantysiliogogogochensis TaxID=2590453 RepID=A0A540WIQ6_9BACT|nr:MULTISPECIES: hypothetical protein [Myxococcus]NTX04299.1 hypothetical protein [Myxococcus sp. CA040A]NTX13081.1 hypothetical protein [Myxococcus sp. CA056]NTX36467.1 hypothetical protein [Myxococcus sp. CA033]NTX56754.1 hypothetical protein [Myxococcus sp. CA039A]NTX64775.1 hypothetical protein [Myxococcus sp. CA051A]